MFKKFCSLFELVGHLTVGIEGLVPIFPYEQTFLHWVQKSGTKFFRLSYYQFVNTARTISRGVTGRSIWARQRAPRQWTWLENVQKVLQFIWIGRAFDSRYWWNISQFFLIIKLFLHWVQKSVLNFFWFSYYLFVNTARIVNYSGAFSLRNRLELHACVEWQAGQPERGSARRVNEHD